MLHDVQCRYATNACECRQLCDLGNIKDQISTPGGNAEQWSSTPSSLSANRDHSLHTSIFSDSLNPFGFPPPQQQEVGLFPFGSPYNSSEISGVDMQGLSQSGEQTTYHTLSDAITPPLPKQPSQKYAAPTCKFVSPRCKVVVRFLLTGNSLRYRVTLNAPTAMIKHAEEIPVTYLNKGQLYTMVLIDTAPIPMSATRHIKYHTYIGISFEDEQQRQRPAECWQRWEETRGIVEAHQRGGRLQAVEFVNNWEGDAQEKPRVELESASLRATSSSPYFFFAITGTLENLRVSLIL